MAGSYFNCPNQDDPILNARLEALSSLADHITEPVVIVDPELRLVYANASAKNVGKSCPLFEESLGNQMEPLDLQNNSCDFCPTHRVFQEEKPNPHPSILSRNTTQTTNNCPFPHASPLTGRDEQTGLALMMGKTGNGTVVRNGVITSPPETKPCYPLSRDEAFHALIGETPVMQQLNEMIHLVARSDATVLIQGESGTGKELVAKTIHRLSCRKDHPFIVVDCSALPETLLESELFGHVRGAFTGAVSSRKGLFEEAEGGTIFLDEIADTSLAFQAKLLRVLQEGEIKPVGSSRNVKVNVRVVSASNKPLSDLMKAKAFRHDLYYRVAVLPLEIPPLRDRRDDVPLLVDHVLECLGRKKGEAMVTVTPETMEALIKYPWPGNVRELENLIERATLKALHSVLTVSDVFGPICEDEVPGDLSSISKIARSNAEKTRILEALQEVKGRKTQAARLLKISRASLYNKLKAYNIQ